MPEINKPLYEYEDFKSFPKPIDMPPFWIELSGVSHCDGEYRVFREDSKVCVCEYIIKGSGTLHIGGKTYHPKAGDIYILPEFEKHEYYTDPEDPWTKIFFNVRGTGVSSMLNAFEMKNKVLFSGCEELRPIFEKLFAKTQEDMPIEQIMIDCCELFVQLLFRLYNKIKTTDETLEEVQKVKAFIENNIERELSMKEIADSIYRSRDYTNRLFKRYYNITPYAYYTDLRIEKAKALLQHTSLSVQQISEKLGYKNGKSFSKHFRYTTGMTASCYRRIEHGARKDGEENDGKPKTVKILCIGHSYAMNSCEYLTHIAKSQGVDMTVGIAYSGNCPMRSHHKWLKQGQVYGVLGNEESACYRKYTGTQMTDHRGTHTLRDMLLDEKWDYCIFQQRLDDAGVEEAVMVQLEALFREVSQILQPTNPEVKYLYHQIWALEDAKHNPPATHEPFFDAYQFDTQTMNDMVEAASRKAARYVGGIMIPSGNAFMNARKTESFDVCRGGKMLVADGVNHANVYGQYLAGLTWFQSICAMQIDGETVYIPQEITCEEAKILLECSIKAVRDEGIRI